MHSVDYSTLVRSNWRRRATVRACLFPWRAAAQRSAAVGASVHTANALRAAGPSEPTPQNPFARHRLRRFNKTGRALFEEPPLLGIGCETTSILRGKRSSWATACWETGSRDPRARHGLTARQAPVHADSTPEARGDAHGKRPRRIRAIATLIGAAAGIVPNDAWGHSLAESRYSRNSLRWLGPLLSADNKTGRRGQKAAARRYARHRALRTR